MQDMVLLKCMFYTFLSLTPGSKTSGGKGLVEVEASLVESGTTTAIAGPIAIGTQFDIIIKLKDTVDSE